ncbi:MAG: flagellar hook-length control protein FliK [Betaproteobacteria bacterium]
MQNLTLQTMQSTPLKKMSDSANKTNSSTDHTGSAEVNSPFQQMLNKQVQQTPEKQAESKPVVAKQADVKAAEKVNNTDAKPEAVEALPKVINYADSTADIKKANAKNVNVDANSIINSVINLNIADLGQVNLDVKELLVKDTDTKATDTKSAEEVVSKVDANPIDWVVTPLALAVNVIPLVNTQTTTFEVKDGKPAQRNLDVALGQALQQGKVTNASASVEHDVPDAKMQPEQDSWLEAMLPGAAKQALGDESVNAKLLLSAIKEGDAKEITGKNSAMKEISMSAIYQPAAQINVATTAQQLGSANSINVYPGKTGWDQAISQKVVWMVGAGEQSATLTLNPPDLGPLQVVIHVHNDQANTTFISDNPEVRQALEDGMSNLRDKMNASGIQLGQVNVSSGEQSKQPFQQAVQQQVVASATNGSASAPVTEKSSRSLERVSNGLVDTFA